MQQKKKKEKKNIQIHKQSQQRDYTKVLKNTLSELWNRDRLLACLLTYLLTYLVTTGASSTLGRTRYFVDCSILSVKYSPSQSHHFCLCAGSKVHQRAIDTINQNLETEARLKMEGVVVRKRLEQDITELEITLEGVNKARTEAEKNLKQSQKEISDLESLLEDEQKSK